MYSTNKCVCMQKLDLAQYGHGTLSTAQANNGSVSGEQFCKYTRT